MARAIQDQAAESRQNRDTLIMMQEQIKQQSQVLSQALANQQSHVANMYTMFSGCFNQLYSATGIAPPNFQVLAPPQGQSQAMLPPS